MNKKILLFGFLIIILSSFVFADQTIAGESAAEAASLGGFGAGSTLISLELPFNETTEVLYVNWYNQQQTSAMDVVFGCYYWNAGDNKYKLRDAQTGVSTIAHSTGLQNISISGLTGCQSGDYLGWVTELAGREDIHTDNSKGTLYYWASNITESGNASTATASYTRTPQIAYWGVPTASSSNFTITAYDMDWSSDIANFSAVVNGDNYNSNITTKQIVTNINNSQLINITVNADEYFDVTYLNWNTSNNIQANLTINHTELNVSAYDYNGNLINVFTANAESLNSTHIFSASTTSGTAILELLWNETYNISVDAENYSTYGNSVLNKMDLYFEELNITGLYETNTINLTFKNEDTNALMDNVNISFDLISDLFANNYSTSNGTAYLSLLTPEDYMIVYSADGYSQRTYYFTLANRSYNELTLYLSNSTTQVTATVYDEIGNILERARIEVLKYDVATNSYILFEQSETNFQGRATLNLILNTQYYKFRIRYDDELAPILPGGGLTTEQTYISETNIEFQIQTGETVAEEFFTIEGIDVNLIFIESSNSFRFDFSDPSGLVSQFCLEIERSSLSQIIPFDLSCSSSSSGSISIPVTAINGTTYYARAYANLDSEEITLQNLMHFFMAKNDLDGFGLFWTGILILLFAMVGFFAAGPIGALVLHPIPLILMSLIGFAKLQPSIGITWEVLMIIMAFVISRDS